MRLEKINITHTCYKNPHMGIVRYDLFVWAVLYNLNKHGRAQLLTGKHFDKRF